MLEKIVILIEVLVLFLLSFALLPFVVFMLGFCLLLLVSLTALVVACLWFVKSTLLIVVIHDVLICLCYMLATLLIYANLL